MNRLFPSLRCCNLRTHVHSPRHQRIVLKNVPKFFSFRRWMKTENIQFDWSTMEGELPDLPPADEELTKQDKWWEDFIKDPKLSVDENLMALRPEQIPHIQLATIPLSYSPPETMPELHKTMKVEQLAEKFRALLLASKFEEMWDTFLEIRKLGLIPPVDLYETSCSLLSAWLDHKAVEMLVQEMDVLGYPRGEKTWYALITNALVRKDMVEIDRLWKQILAEKIDINAHMHSLRLFVITRNLNDPDMAMSWFRYMKEHDKVPKSDPTPYNLLLDMCEANGLISLAEELFEEMKSEGYLEIDIHRDQIEVNTGGQHREYHIPKLQSLEATYALMVEINTQKHDPVAVNKFTELSKECHFRFMKKVRSKFRLPKRTYFKVIKMYVRMRENRTAITMLKEMSGFERFSPERSMWREVLIMLTQQDPPPTKEFLEIKEHYEMWGFDYDPEFNSYILRMWARALDFRRVKNAYEALILAGSLPNEEARTTMMEVFARGGQVDEVQQFYENEVRSGRNINKRMHQLMIEDYLKRGFPGSATEVLQRMVDDKITADMDVIESIGLGYAKVGAGARIVNIIEKLMVGPKAVYPLSSGMIAVAILGLSKNMSDQDRARDLWDRFSGQIQLDYSSGQKLIEGFSNLKDSQYAALVYYKLKEEWQFKSDDGATLFESLLSVPTSHKLFPDPLSIFADMATAGISPTVTCYEYAMKSKASVGDVLGALKVLRAYIDHTLQKVSGIAVSGFGGLPLHRATCLTFFVVLARFEVGRYGREARAWLRRLQPVEGSTFPYFKSYYEELEKRKNEKTGTHFTALQSFEISRYINKIDESKFSLLRSSDPEADPYAEIFKGGDADIEDILIHDYGFNPEHVYQALGTDPSYLKMKAELERVKLDEAKKKQEDL